jgi:hypothetical protein
VLTGVVIPHEGEKIKKLHPCRISLTPYFCGTMQDYFFLRSLVLVSDTTLWFAPRLNDLFAEGD